MYDRYYQKPNKFYVFITKIVCRILNTFLFGVKVIKNDLKKVKAPFVIIANHEMSLDFVPLFPQIKVPVNFVISRSFYNSLPVHNFMKKLGVIDKQQFQTSVADMKRMFAVVNNGGALCLYPSGMMTEDGLPTPTPKSTYKFLQKLGVDVYGARISGSYFFSPKWSKGLNKGKCFLSIEKLIDKEDLLSLNEKEIMSKTSSVLNFDAYKEQEEFQIKYKHLDNIEGLENVLYKCPKCKKEFVMSSKDNRIYCKECGFEEYSDKLGFLHQKNEKDIEYRYVYQWSQFIKDDLKKEIVYDDELKLKAKAKIQMINDKKCKYEEIGEGTVSLYLNRINLTGVIKGESIDYSLPLVNIPILPFKPGKYFELQNQLESYRLVLDEGQMVMKFINYIKIIYENQCEKSAD